MLRLVMLSFIFAVLSACSHHPLGIDEKTWKTLPPEKKAELLKEEARLAHERRLAELRTQAAEARARAEIEKARQQALQALYRRLSYGELLQISISGGQGDFYRYKPIVPDSFLLPVGEVQPIKLLSTDGDTLELWAGFFPGKLVLCSEKFQDARHFDPRGCAVLVDHFWDRGETHALTVPRRWNRKKPLLRQARLFIRYAPIRDARSRPCH